LGLEEGKKLVLCNPFMGGGGGKRTKYCRGREKLVRGKISRYNSQGKRGGIFSWVEVKEGNGKRRQFAFRKGGERKKVGTDLKSTVFKGGGGKKIRPGKQRRWKESPVVRGKQKEQGEKRPQGEILVR